MSARLAVVFDFDGTLAETREAVSTTVNAALAAHGLPRVHPPWIHGLMGLPLATLFDRLLPRPIKPFDTSPLVGWYRANFDALGAPSVRPLGEADRVLGELEARGVALAVATSREASSLAPLLARFGWSGVFESLATCDRVPAGKPDPALLHLALDELGVSPDRAVMVGDTTWDVEMARAAGVTSVAVPHGSHSRARLEAAQPDVLLDELGALLAWIDARA